MVAFSLITLATEVHFGLATVFLLTDCDEAVPGNVVFSITLLARVLLAFGVAVLVVASLLCCSSIFIVSAEEFSHLTTSSTATGSVSTKDIALDCNGCCNWNWVSLGKGDDPLSLRRLTFAIFNSLDMVGLEKSNDLLTVLDIFMAGFLNKDTKQDVQLFAVSIDAICPQLVILTGGLKCNAANYVNDKKSTKFKGERTKTDNLSSIFSFVRNLRESITVIK
uniref:Uncharacterized protein n=1 Tax=Glossina austeni TaxID=7395 RepID=A0A1A9UZ67_GLOAU